MRTIFFQIASFLGYFALICTSVSVIYSMHVCLHFYSITLHFIR